VAVNAASLAVNEYGGAEFGRLGVLDVEPLPKGSDRAIQPKKRMTPTTIGHRISRGGV
jgi:hypothetical protein